MDFLKKLNVLNVNNGSCIGGVEWIENKSQNLIDSLNPSNGEKIASVNKCSENDYEKVVKYSIQAFDCSDKSIGDSEHYPALASQNEGPGLSSSNFTCLFCIPFFPTQKEEFSTR